MESIWPPRWHAALLVSALPMAAAGSPALALEPSEIYERYAAAVVTVVGSEGVGSGFAVPPNGYVVTNSHVIRQQSWLQVILRTGETRTVTSVLMDDPNRDLAVLVVSPAPPSTVVLGDSSRVRIGEKVVSIASPRGLPQTLTDGILSQVRTIRDADVTVLQTTVPISPGSSGGPVFNARGEVIGVISFSFRASQGLNFAVGINELKRLLGGVAGGSPATPPAPARAPAGAPAGRRQAGYTIHLRNGSTVSAIAFAEVGDAIVYEQPEGAMTIPRALVTRIVRREDGAIIVFTDPTPPPPQAPLAERKVDVREIIARPPAPGPPREAAPPAPPGPATLGGVCARDVEEVAPADRQVVAPHVLRLKLEGRWVLVDVRRLQPADIPDAKDRHTLEHILSIAQQVTLASRRRTGSERYEAILCVDGKDIAEHPSMRRFRSREAAPR